MLCSAPGYRKMYPHIIGLVNIEPDKDIPRPIFSSNVLFNGQIPLLELTLSCSILQNIYRGPYYAYGSGCGRQPTVLENERVQIQTEPR